MALRWGGMQADISFRRKKRAAKGVPPHPPTRAQASKTHSLKPRVTENRKWELPAVHSCTGADWQVVDGSGIDVSLHHRHYCVCHQ